MSEPAHPPVPCSPDALYLHGIRCVLSGEETSWQDVWVSAAEIAPPAPLGLVKAGCGGGQCAKAEAIKTARERGWSADELVKVLKALGS